MSKILQQSWVAAPAAVTPFCHGSTILALPGGDMLSAWFGGTWEAETDTGIYLARRPAGTDRWEPPSLVVSPDGFAHGNAVLFAGPAGTVLLAYFRNYGDWCTGGKSFVRTSRDGGRTWSLERPISTRTGILTKNKPIPGRDGAILLPVYDEILWQSGLAISRNGGETWQVDTRVGQGTGVPMIQGSLARDHTGALHMLMRTKAARVYDAVSLDDGQTWGAPFAVSLDNPNSGTDALGLADGRMLLVYNPSDKVARDILSAAERDYRYPLCLALSEDDGLTWRDIAVLESEPGEYSYPAIVQDGTGLVHITYTYHRSGIRHAVLEPPN